MRLPQGPLDGAQPRSFVLDVLGEACVGITALGGDWYELVDLEGDSEVLYLTDPILRDMVIRLWERFGALHSLLPTDFVATRH